MDRSKKYERENSTGDSGFLSMKSAELDTRSESDIEIDYDFEKLHIYSQLHANTDDDFGYDFNEDFLEPFEKCFRQNDEGDTELHKAIVKKDLKRCLEVITLAPHPVLLDIVNDQSLSALHLAVLYQETHIIRRLVLAGANTNIRMTGGNTPLHLACLRGDYEGARALTDLPSLREVEWISKFSDLVPVDLELWNHAGKTSLHIAASIGNLGLVRLLVGLGANVNSPDGLGGMTAVHLAIENGHREVVRFLVEVRPECLDTVTYNGYTPYQMAYEIDPKLAQDLVSLGADPISRSGSESSISCSDDELMYLEQKMEDDYITMKKQQDPWMAMPGCYVNLHA